MKKLKFTKKEYNLAKSLVMVIAKEIRKEHPKLIRADSNLFHFIIYNVIKKTKLKITNGWFKNGPYVPVVDDILIDLKWMDKSQHQMYGDEKIMNKVIECKCHSEV